MGRFPTGSFHSGKRNDSFQAGRRSASAGERPGMGGKQAFKVVERERRVRTEANSGYRPVCSDYLDFPRLALDDSRWNENPSLGTIRPRSRSARCSRQCSCLSHPYCRCHMHIVARVNVHNWVDSGPAAFGSWQVEIAQRGGDHRSFLLSPRSSERLPLAEPEPPKE